MFWEKVIRVLKECISSSKKYEMGSEWRYKFQEKQNLYVKLHCIQQQPVTKNSTNIGIVHHNCRPTKNTTIKHHDPLCSYIAHALIARTPSKPTPTSYPRSKWANTISMHNLGQEKISTSFCLFQKSSLRYFFLTRIHERGKQILPFEVYESLLEQFDKIALSE